MSDDVAFEDTHVVAEKLRALVSKILAVPVEGIDDEASFVSLGGDSFKAVHLYQKCAEEGLRVRFQDILHKPFKEVVSLATSPATSDLPDASSRRRNDGNKKFPQMPLDYEFGKIHDELEKKYNLNSEEIEDVYPCSPMQESMYIGQNMGSQRLYRTRGLFEAQSGFDLTHFAKIWNDIIRRHQTLRTIYVETSDPSSGRLLDAVVLKSRESRVTITEVEDVENVKRMFNARELDRGFHDEDDSQHRITIYTNTRERQNTQMLFEVELNHLTVDGSSLMIIIGELVKGLQGFQLAWPAPGYGRYIDYIQNQADEDAALDYWIDYLENTEPSYFPTMNDNHTGAKGSFEVVEIPLELGLNDLRAFCQNFNATISNALQAVWALVLYTYTGDPNVCFGYLSSGRSLPIPGISEIVGPMMNLLICRVNGIDSKSLGALLMTIRDDFVNALPHQCFSIGKVQRILGTNEAKLFNTIITSYYSASLTNNNGGDFFKLVASHNASDFDLVLKVVYSDSDIRVRLAYSTATLSPAMAKSVSHTVSSILGRLAVMTDPDIRIDQAAMISPWDMSQVTAWNHLKRPPETLSTPVHQLIEIQSQLRPDAPAIHAWDGEMTYEKLNAAASAVAHHIISLGVGPGAFVALCFKKSKWYSVALLGVLKSGNAFVPIDISNPAARKQEILQQLETAEGAGLVICSRREASLLRGFALNVLELDDEALAAMGSANPTQPLPTVSLTDPAYVIFTSGSTGTPKGVVVEHKAYAYAAQVHSAGIHIDWTSRVLQFASYGFDTSMEDHLSTFIAGACLCVPSEEDRLSLPDLGSFTSKAKANWAHLTPSFAEMLTPALMPTMKTMVLGGEAMTAKNIETWACPGQTELIQVYGPSECCVTSTISPVMSPGSDPTNIGSAMPGCKTWIVRPGDPALLQAVGAVGELLMEGPILARGYLNAPEQTEKSFVQGLSWAPQKRLYRTGDLVKYDSIGHLHFVGRRDGQIKLRGQRIELGEIERQMAIDPRVQHCVAVVPNSGPCAKKLVAVVMLSEPFANAFSGIPGSSSPIELLDTCWLEHINCMRDFLLAKLPPYMSPELWVILKSMPRNSSGKLDRKRIAKYLEGLTQEEFTSLMLLMEDKSLERAGNEAELSMRRIWSEVLNVPEEEICWDSSFYYLGGDSISAMAISSMARQIGLYISAADILRYRSIERLVRASTQSTQNSPSQTAAVDNSDSSATSEPFPLSPIQRLHFQASPEGDALDQQTMVVQVTRKVDQDELLGAIQSLLHAYPMLRARFERCNGEWTQQVPCISGSAAVDECRVRFHSRDEPSYVLECISEAKRSINLTNGPLIAIDAFETRCQTLMSFTIHHLVIDTVSWRILFRELEEFLLFGKSISQEATSFRSWCLAQQQFALDLHPQDVLPSYRHVPATDLGFWNMIGKRNCFKDTVFRTITLNTALTQALSSAQARVGISALDIMASAVIESFLEVFGRAPGLFIEGHGREPFTSEVDPSNTVGWFTTFSPLIAERHQDILRSVQNFHANSPYNGLSYFSSRFLSSASAEAFKDRHFPMEVTLNYLGSFQQFEREESLFKRCDDDLQMKLSELRREQRAESSRYSLISILAVTKDDQLSIQVEQNTQMSHQDQLADWLLQLEQTLERNISNLSTSDSYLPTTTSQTLSSFVGVGCKQFNKVVDLATTRFGLSFSEIEAVYPCSPIQDSLILSQLKNPTNSYSQHFLFKLSGREPLDPDRLSVAWKTVVTSHPILRTIFLEDESGAFFQVVRRFVNPDVEIFSLGDESDLDALWAQQSGVTGPAPLSGSTLHKLQVYTSNDGSAYCLLDKNHIITDGTTSRLLIRNFLAVYDGFPTQATCPYSNYIDYVQKQDMCEISNYWTQYLDGATACHFPRLRQQLPPSSHPVEFTRSSSGISDKSLLNDACRKLDLTLPGIFQAAWAVVLSAYLNSDDVVFGLLGHGRDIPVPGASEIIGPMANIVPMRVHFDTCSKISDVLRSVQDDSIEHISRQAISLARIQHAAKRNGEAMFNTIFNFQKTSPPSESGNIKSELLFAHDTSEYDIAVCVTEDPGRFHITIESPTTFMSKAQAERLLAVYRSAVHTISAESGTRIQDLSLATDLDQNQLQEWNPTKLETNNQCIHSMIAETTRRQPSRPAICSWDGDMSYADLDSLSTKLAAQLQSLGVGPEQIVVLCFEKSIWAVVAMLAVAKSGAAFVHIDPKGAPKRTKSVIEQAESRFGLTSAAQLEKLASLVETVIPVNKTSIEGLPATLNCSETKLPVNPSNTLYIIFTSGTTGTPKGVVIQHKSFCSAVASNKSWLQIKAESRVLQFTNYCFDASLEEIFTVLVAGGCICIPSESDRMSDISGFIARKRVNWAAFTPSFLRTLNPDELDSVDFITVHAEPMGQDLVARWAAKFHMRPSYGPTECSVTSTVGAPFSIDTDATNIGWPVGCRGWVVHPENHNILMPVGAVGELLLDGPIVGKGYLNDEAKTEAAFIHAPTWATIADPCSQDQTPRKLYKTGDLVRYAEDGSLLMQRRKDHSQVKIRGQRVELGEIQHHLNNLVGIVRHSMVLVPRAGALKGRLVAVASLVALSSRCEIGDHDQGIKIVRKSDLDEAGFRNLAIVMDEIRTLLEKELPRYMIPETWLLVRNLPTQLSLKLDYQRVISWVDDISQEMLQEALEIYQSTNPVEQCGSQAEETVRKIWGEVLGIKPDQIALDQLFFRLGGDSIYAMQVMRLCREFGFQVTTQDVLANPTVRKLASVASRDAEGRCSIPTPPQSPNSSPFMSPFTQLVLSTDNNVETVTPCSSFQQRMYQAFLKKPQKPYLFNSLVALSDKDRNGALEPNALLQAWQWTVDRHAILRSVFVLDPSSKQLFQKVLKKYQVDFAVQSVETEDDAIRQSRLHLSSIRSKIFKDDSPPVSVRILIADRGETFFHFVMGHILIDHVSLAHVFSDFAAFYQGRIPSPAMLPSGFHHYVQHINRTRDLGMSNQYWVDKFRGAPSCMVPIDSMANRRSPDVYSMGSVTFTLERTTELVDFLREAGVTLSNLLQFTWAILLHIRTGHTSVCFGQLASDRDIDLPCVDEIVGPMLSMMVARADLNDSTVTLDALRAFQEDNIQSLRYKTFDLTEVESQLGREDTGLFNTMVNYRKVKYSGDDPAVNFRSIWKQDPHEQLLVLAFNEGPARLDATLAYYESILSEATVRVMSEDYCRIVGILASGRHRTVGDIKSSLGS